MKKKYLEKLGRILRAFGIYSGLAFVFSKFTYNTKKKVYPNGVIWVLGIYFSIFTFSITVYQNRLDRIDLKISYFTRLVETNNKDLDLILNNYVEIKNSLMPYPPRFLYPHLTFLSFIGKTVKYSDIYELQENLVLAVNPFTINNCFDKQSIFFADFSDLKFTNSSFYNVTFFDCIGEFADFSDAIIRQNKYDHCFLQFASFQSSSVWSTTFKNSYCRDVDFFDCDLKGVNFESSDLTNADFRGARNLKPEYLANAKTLAGTTFDEVFLEELKHEHHKIFDMIMETPAVEITAKEFLGLAIMKRK